MKNVGILAATIAVLFSCGTAHAERTIWYVHPDSALNTIRAGLDSCANNDTVLVAPGTYYENIVWPNTQGIHLVSELGRDTTIIDGNNVSRVITIEIPVDTTTLIKGFTIQNGANVMRGGGIRCHQQASPSLVNLNITGNCSSDAGGGIYLYYANPKLIVVNITDNGGVWFGGGLCLWNQSCAYLNNE